MRHWILASLLLFQAPSNNDLTQVLARTTAYVESYTAALGGIIGDERYVQKGAWSCGGCQSALDTFMPLARHIDALIDGGATIIYDGVGDPSSCGTPGLGAAAPIACPQMGRPDPQSKSMARSLLSYESRERTLLADFRTTPVGDMWLGVRRPRQVDGVAIDPAFWGRMAESYDLSTSVGQQQLKKAIGFENARYTIGDPYFTTSIPTSPLEIFRSANIAGYRFEKQGEEVVDSVRTWKIEATDLAGLRTADFWIEPATGRIFRADFGTKDFVLKEFGPASWTSVRYGVSTALDMLVPISMDEDFKSLGLLMEGHGHADYTNYRRFRADVRLIADDEKEPDAATSDPYLRKVEVPAVTLNAWVSGSGGPLLNLKADDFTLTENNVPQTITKFSPVRVPYDVLLLFDRSGSTIGGSGSPGSGPAYDRMGASSLQHSAETLIASMQPQDRIGVAGFGSMFHMLSKWNDSPEEVLKAFSKLSSFADFRSVYSAVEHALISELLPVSGRRRALILVTDGRDSRIMRTLKQESHVVPSDQDPAFQQMIDIVKRERIPVYVIALNTDRNPMSGTTEDDEYVQLQLEYRLKGLLHPTDESLRSIPQDYLVAARAGLEQLAQASGGHIFFPKKWEDLAPVYRQIGEELGTAYSLGYVSNLSPDDQRYRQIAVSTRNNTLQVVQSVSGYEAMPASTAGPVEANSESLAALSELGQASFDAGEYQNAVDQLSEAVHQGSTSPNVYFLLGSSYYKLAEVDLAEENLSRALAIDPTLRNAYLQLYNVYMMGQQPAKALEAVETYLAKFPVAEDREYVQSMADKLKKKLNP